jgi:xanthine/uracil/vitamin C permease (AzgA family)
LKHVIAAVSTILRRVIAKKPLVMAAGLGINSLVLLEIGNISTLVN